MNTKFFVPYGTAKLLKEKGYPQLEPEHHYNINGEMVIFSDDYEGYTEDIIMRIVQDFYAAPTYHEVLDWLENKDIIIESTKRWVRGNYYAWFSDVHRYDGTIETFVEETREEAINQAIIYALELI